MLKSLKNYIIRIIIALFFIFAMVFALKFMANIDLIPILLAFIGIK